MITRRAVERIAVLLAALVGIFAPAAVEATAIGLRNDGLAEASAATFTYDATAVARVDVHSRAAAGAALALLSDVREESASLSIGARGTSTTLAFTSVATNRADDVVGSHGSMPRPRPAGMESHHGVNSVWAEANIPGYRAADAPAVLMPSAGHNATRGVFNRWRSEIAGRQGVPIRDIDWAAVSPGSAWSLAEEQFAAAGTAASTIDDYFAQWNRYLDGLRGGM